MSAIKKLFIGLSLGVGAAVVSFAIAQTHRDADRPSAATPRTSVSTPAQVADATDDGCATAGSCTAAGSVAPELAALREEVAHLRDEVAALSATASTRSANTTAQAIEDLRRRVATLQQDPAAEEPLRDPAALAAAERDRQVLMEGVENSFRHEPDDRGWADQTSAALREGLEEFPDLDVRSLDCRSHTCRLELAGDGTGQAAELLSSFLMQIGPMLPNVMGNQIEYSNGSRSTILYMTARANEDGG